MEGEGGRFLWSRLFQQHIYGKKENEKRKHFPEMEGMDFAGSIGPYPSHEQHANGKGGSALEIHKTKTPFRQAWPAHSVQNIACD